MKRAVISKQFNLRFAAPCSNDGQLTATTRRKTEKIKTFLSRTKRRTEGEEVQLHPFLTAALDGHE